MNATCAIPLQPNCRYRLSFDVKTDLDDVKRPSYGASAVVCMAKHGYGARCFPNPRLTGQHGWQRISGEFKTPPQTRPDEAVLVLWLWGNTGTVHYDRVVVEKLP